MEEEQRPTTSPFHASAHIDHTKKGPSPPSGNVRVNSSGLLAMVKPDEDVRLDLAKDDRKPPALPLGEDVAPPPPSLEGAKPPPFPADEDIPPPPPTDVSKITKAKTEDQTSRKRGDTPKRPSLIPPPLGVKLAENNVKPPTPVVDESSDSDGAPPPPPNPPKCPWTEEWDPNYKRLYYLHIDVRSQWEVPAGYWRNEA